MSAIPIVATILLFFLLTYLYGLMTTLYNHYIQ
nr:MAG TPA: hypothetical protein [Caudoviricetes sp.]